MTADFAEFELLKTMMQVFDVVEKPTIGEIDVNNKKVKALRVVLEPHASMLPPWFVQKVLQDAQRCNLRLVEQRWAVSVIK